MKFSAAVAQILMVSLLMAIAGAATAQQAYPSKLIRFIVPFAPGGLADSIARMVSQKLAGKWGQPVIVENRPGGNTIIGTDAVAKALPDGYTIGYATSTNAILPSQLPHLPYDIIKDFAPVCTLIISNYVLVLNPSVPSNTLQEFIALAKAKPGQLNDATGGSGTPPHLAGELFNIMAGVKMQHIHYKGGAPAIADLIGGQVQLAFATPIDVIAHIKSGRLKAIAISGATRLPALPQVPTFAEAGLPGFEASVWQAIVAPAGTPKAIIDKMSSEMAVILAMPDTQEYIAKRGMEPFISTPDQTAALIRTEIDRYAKIIKAANIKLEN